MKSIGYLNGRWIDVSEIAIPIDDVGFFQGVTAVERLRTWDGRLPLIDAHLRRFRHSAEFLGIAGLPDAGELTRLIDELEARNPSELDSGIVLFATPGRRRVEGKTGEAAPTLGLHRSPLDLPRIEALRRDGQPLVVTTVRQPSPECWPRDIKVRSRIHYYLADRFARGRDSAALGVLLDDDGSITETSVANIAIVHGGRLVAPPADRVLPGVVLGTVCRLADQQGIEVERRPISVDELRAADEVLLTGTDVGVWPVRKIDGVVKTPGPVCRALQASLRQFLTEPDPN